MIASHPLFHFLQWDDETDMAKLEECVRSVQADGLLWGTSKLVPVGYGIKKLQIACVVEDDKVGTDLLEEEITKFEDYVSTRHFCNASHTHVADRFLSDVIKMKMQKCKALIWF